MAFLVSKLGFTTTQLVSILITKLWQVDTKCKNCMFFIFWVLLSPKCNFLRFWYFSSLSSYPIISIFQWQYLPLRFMFLMKHLSSKHRFLWLLEQCFFSLFSWQPLLGKQIFHYGHAVYQFNLLYPWKIGFMTEIPIIQKPLHSFAEQINGLVSIW